MKHLFLLSGGVVQISISVILLVGGANFHQQADLQALSLVVAFLGFIFGLGFFKEAFTGRFAYGVFDTFRWIGSGFKLALNLVIKAVVKRIMIRMESKYFIDGGLDDTAFKSGEGRIFDIEGHGHGNSAYLRRYKIIENNWFPWRLYIHKFLRDDLDCPHDHPWNFLTYVVDGKYYEHVRTLESMADDYRYCGNNATDMPFKEMGVRSAGDLAFRKAEHIHTVALPKSINPSLMAKLENEPCITIMLTFKQKRSWYFYENDNGTVAKVPWKTYLGLEDAEKKYGGEG